MEQHPAEGRVLRMSRDEPSRRKLTPKYSSEPPPPARAIDSRHIGKAGSRNMPGAREKVFDRADVSGRRLSAGEPWEPARRTGRRPSRSLRSLPHRGTAAPERPHGCRRRWRCLDRGEWPENSGRQTPPDRPFARIARPNRCRLARSRGRAPAPGPGWPGPGHIRPYRCRRGRVGGRRRPARGRSR